MTNFENIKSKLILEMKNVITQLEKTKSYDELWEAFDNFCSESSITSLTKIDICDHCPDRECCGSACNDENNWLNEEVK